MFTPDNITELKENEIFVFGSNLNGNHAGGAARVAVEKFGAIMGQAEGPQGQSYAIPTLDTDMNKVTEEQLQKSLKTFAQYASEHSVTTFYLTRIGCGIAGFSEEEIINILNKVDLPANVVVPESFNVIYSFKGFDSSMKCRGFQYEVGKEYEESAAAACQKGFHACRNPFDVLSYYPLIDDNGNISRFASVEQRGEIDRSEKDKVCSTKIKIKAELGLPGFIKACIEWIKEYTSPVKVLDKVDGNYAQIGSSGNSAKIGSSGNSAKIGSSGDSAQIGSSGDYAQIGSSGDYAKIGSSGNSAKIGSSGDYAKIGSSGDYAQIGSSGDSAQIGSSGDSAQIGSSGDSAQIGSSGDSAQIGSSGNYAKIGSSGNSAKIGSSGNSAKIQSTGEDSVIMCAGNNSIVSAKRGSWITLSEWKYNEKKGRFIPICVKTAFVDGIIIKGFTPYKLVNGEFEEVK